jgi:peptidoglycan hydrolase-like protein with peptidoglycan-binding domain
MTRSSIIAGFLALACLPLSGAAALAGQASTSSTAVHKSTHKKARKHAKREVGPKAPTPERISEIQSALGSRGYYQGDPNGLWDSNTVDAMQKFQSANGIDPTGKLDAPTLQKLGLGSDIAGVSAPKSVVPPPASPAPAGPDSHVAMPSGGSTTTAANADAPPAR